MMLFHHSVTAFTTAIWVARSTPMAIRRRNRMRISLREEEAGAEGEKEKERK
jgi:hypothetical protein